MDHLLQEIAENLQSCQGAASLAKMKLLELLGGGGHEDLANVAEHLSAVSRQMNAYIELVASFRS